MSKTDSLIIKELAGLKGMSMPDLAKQQFLHQYFSPEKPHLGSVWFRLAFIFLLMFLSSTGFMVAAATSQPGQLLYLVKEALQSMNMVYADPSPSPFKEQTTSPTPTSSPQSEANTTILEVSSPAPTPKATMLPTPVPTLLPTTLPSPSIQVELPGVDIGIGGSTTSPLPLPTIPDKLRIDLPIIPPFEVDTDTLGLGF